MINVPWKERYPALVEATTAFLKDWFVDHIMRSDLDYADWMKSFYRRAKIPVQAEPKRGRVLDPFTSDLVAWVVSGCGDAEWRFLVARKCDSGAPPWLDGDRLGLDDLSHRILLLAVAHLVHTQQ